MITLENFGVSYKSFSLQPLTLELGADQCVALVGPNGAGKSTTMKGLSGRLKDYTGEIRFRSYEVRTLLPQYRAWVGLLPEKLLGLGWMTVSEHLRFLRSFYPSWDDAYAHTLRERLELQPDARVGTLSKGMAVKLSFIAAEAYRPPVLLLDEPTSGLDPVVRRELIGLIRELADRKEARLIVFSTHILEDVEFVADRVIMLRAGALVGDESMANLQRNARGSSVSSILFDQLSAGGMRA